MTIHHFLALATVLFFIGAAGFLTRRNAITVFMSLELQLNAVNLALVAAARHWGNLDGQVIAFFVIAVAAVEVAVGLSILIAVERTRDTVYVDDLSVLNE
ncbi:MAG: NADH-quinone oxidoreductase subunit NuoK [Candidatus Eisenbacteria bacterium]|nr:NADH-quinone oxidoreductase subunit NuoK [Candidatus Eisenbacteria bacterium]